MAASPVIARPNEVRSKQSDLLRSRLSATRMTKVQIASARQTESCLAMTKRAHIASRQAKSDQAIQSAFRNSHSAIEVLSSSACNSSWRWVYFFMMYTSPLLRGTLIKRYRRFLVDVRLEEGTTVTAHCPNSGTLRGCSDPGAAVLLSDSKDAARRHPLTWELVEVDGDLVCINTLLCRKLMLEAIEQKSIPPLHAFEGIHHRATSGSGAKVDFMLHGMERNGFVNLYHVTWAEKGIALFPDVVHPRAQSTLRHLTDIAGGGHYAAAIFLVQRGDCTALKPAEQIDREFTKIALDAYHAGVDFRAYRTRVGSREIRLGDTIPFTLG